MIVSIFLMYCDLSNYRSLLNSFNKYDFVCQEFEMSCILIRVMHFRERERSGKLGRLCDEESG